MLAIIHHITKVQVPCLCEPDEPMRMWNATEYTREYSLLNSPFYQIIY